MLHRKLTKHLVSTTLGSLSGYFIVYLQAVSVSILLKGAGWIQSENLLIALTSINTVVNVIYGLFSGWLISKLLDKENHLMFCLLFLVSFILVNFLLVVYSGTGIKMVHVFEYFAIILSLLWMVDLLPRRNHTSE